MNPNLEVQRLIAENQQLRALLMQNGIAPPPPMTMAAPNMLAPPATAQPSFFGKIGSAISQGADKYGATAAQAAAQAALAAQSAPKGQRSGAALRSALAFPAAQQ